MSRSLQGGSQIEGIKVVISYNPQKWAENRWITWNSNLTYIEVITAFTTGNWGPPLAESNDKHPPASQAASVEERDPETWFRRSLAAGIAPDVVTFNTLINAAAKKAQLSNEKRGPLEFLVVHP